jgi:acyl-CoA thioesterase
VSRVDKIYDAMRTSSAEQRWLVGFVLFADRADPNVPILYQVQRLRDGKSYATR